MTGGRPGPPCGDAWEAGVAWRRELLCLLGGAAAHHRLALNVWDLLLHRKLVLLRCVPHFHWKAAIYLLAVSFKIMVLNKKMLLLLSHMGGLLTCVAAGCVLG